MRNCTASWGGSELSAVADSASPFFCLGKGNPTSRRIASISPGDGFRSHTTGALGKSHLSYGLSGNSRTAPRRTGSKAESQGAPKRKRASQSQPKTSSTSKKIACVSCGQADVPLMMGGRFCRPCMDAGKASNETTAGPQDVGIVPHPSQPSSQSLSTTAVNEQIARQTAPPLVSHSPLVMNSPLIPSTTDSMTATLPYPPAAKS